MELTGDHIEKLGDEDLRTLVLKLCQAELRRTGNAESAVTAGGNQTAKDGGVDVAVRLDASVGALDFIPRLKTYFQVKCTDMPPADIKKEMSPKGVLRDGLKELVTEGGAYVIVSSKGTVADSSLRTRIETMEGEVGGEPNAPSLRCDFYDRVRLAQWVKQYPGVELWVRDRVGARLNGWHPYGAWARGELGPRYIHNEEARLSERASGQAPSQMAIPAGLDRLRILLDQPGQVARLVGLSGTGKTRFVQALLEGDVGDEKPLDC